MSGLIPRFRGERARRIFRTATALVFAAAMSSDPAWPADGDFTIVLFPDTQYYMTQTRNVIWISQCQWVVDNRLARNIVAVLGLGDATDMASPPEFEYLRKGLSLINDARIPLVPLAGTHDYGEAGMGEFQRGTIDRFNYCVESLGISSKPWFGGAFEPGYSNYFVKLDVGDRKFLVIALEVYPRRAAVDWAAGVLDANRDREAIVLTHAYLTPDGKLAQPDEYMGSAHFGLATPELGMCGAQLWDYLIRKKANIKAVFCAHQLGVFTAYSPGTGDAGNTVHQFIINYQSAPGGGEGWVGLVEFKSGAGKAAFSAYRTWARSGLGYDVKRPASLGPIEVDWAP